MTAHTAASNPRWRLVCGWLTLFVVGTDLFIVSPLLPAIASEFALSPAVAGLSVTVFSAIYLFAAPFLGHLADRIGRGRVLLTCLGVFVLAKITTALASSFAILLLARIVAGASTAGVSPVIYAGVGEAAPTERRATWMAIAVSGLLLSLSIGAPVGSLIASTWGWRAPFWLLAALALGLIGANRLAWPADAISGASGTVAQPLGVQAATMRLLPTVLWATALYGAYTYLGVWLAGAGQTPPEIARAIGCYGAGALAGALLGGHLADRFGVRAVMIASLGGLTICLIVLASGVDPDWKVDVLLLTMSLFAQLYFPAQQAGLTRQFPARRALILALNNSALFLGISGGSLIGGQAVARFGFRTDAAIGACLAGACLLFVAWLYRASTDRPGIEAQNR